MVSGYSIRKISVGVPKVEYGKLTHGMVYTVGHSAKIKDNDGNDIQGVIESITWDESYMVKYSKTVYNVWVKFGEEVTLWKTIENQPVIVEYDTAFNINEVQ